MIYLSARVPAQLFAQLAVHAAAVRPRAHLEALRALGCDRRAVPRPLRCPLPLQRRQLRLLRPLRHDLLPGRQHLQERDDRGPRGQQRRIPYRG